MNEKLSTRRKVKETEQQKIRNRKTGTKKSTRTKKEKTSVKILSKKPGREKTEAEAVTKEKKINLLSEISKINKKIEEKFMKMEQAEREKQRLLCMIIWGTPTRPKRKSRRSW